jgi:hypothetical protein
LKKKIPRSPGPRGIILSIVGFNLPKEAGKLRGWKLENDEITKMVDIAAVIQIFGNPSYLGE